MKKKKKKKKGGTGRLKTAGGKGLDEGRGKGQARRLHVHRADYPLEPWKKEGRGGGKPSVDKKAT